MKKVANELLLEKRCNEFVTICETMKLLEEKRKELREEIKENLRNEGVTEKVITRFNISISEFPKEYFSLKDAKDSLPARILKMLAPFIKVNQEERLNVSLRPGNNLQGVER